ncbi:hypothetical protein [Sphingobium sp. MI1205]|uniref:hypothetical protein n=1 Tax=Sphingobium sp. MI1205 TaxID=407020 RepID=UPI0011A89A50|nr:hypothetical protein [Sphingobium sp. MI1205]
MIYRSDQKAYSVKDWFPLAEYEFYAFVASGMLLIAALDYSLTGGVLVNRTNWNIIDGVFWTVVAYLTGQITAGPSSSLIEHLLARRLLSIPADIQLGLRDRNWVERRLAACFAPREYAPLREPIRARALARAAKQLGVAEDQLDGETVFQAAFHPVRGVSDTVGRLNSFMNQYGMSRNICFVSLVAVGALTYRQLQTPTNQTAFILAGSAVLAVGMFGRFLKFYSAYSSDVIRTYATLPADKVP